MEGLEWKESGGHGDQLGHLERGPMMRGWPKGWRRGPGLGEGSEGGSVGLRDIVHVGWKGEKLNMTPGCAV